MHPTLIADSMILEDRIRLMLTKVDTTLQNKWKYEPHGLLNGSGGASLYFMYRYLQTKSTAFMRLAVEILENEIEKTNLQPLEQYLSIGSASASSCWLISQLVNANLLEEEERLQSQPWIEHAIESTTEEELNANKHDLFYGFIGKALLAIEHDRDMAYPFVKRVVSALLKNLKHDEHGAYWTTPNPPYVNSTYAINMGIPHGMTGILLFLFRCWETYDLKSVLKAPIDSGVAWMRNKLTLENNALRYEYSDKISGSGNLGWCYGDLAITFTLLRHYQLMKDQDSLTKAQELIEQSLNRRGKTGISYYSEFDIYDVRLCHGTASIAYMYKKIYELTDNELLKRESDNWTSITVDTLERYFKHAVEIESKHYEYFNSSCSFLNGFSGVGLVLLSFVDPKNAQWNKILLLS